jgi:hypothetical protein
MGDHCVALESLRNGFIPYMGTELEDTNVPVNGKNAVKSQITATADPH